MKLATFSHGDQILAGVLDGERLIPLASQRPLAEQIAHGVFTGEADLAGAVPLAEARLLAPITPRRNFICVGWNYVSHFEEGKGKRGGGLQDSQELPAFPTFFCKATTAAAGPFDDLPIHRRTTERLDWEVELAVVIGKDGGDIAEADALDHVFGYTAANDISAREIQRRHGGQWFKGKSLDRTCPIGPLLVTADEIGDPQALALSCTVNGEEKQGATTRQMHFHIRRIIAELSAGMTLLAGDIILTGTPEGVGFTREPPEFLKAGDVMETFVEKVGTMRHRFVE
jgi:2-keto-4-pentenoate hydratase/2-oxohepta-3-ene-1,7-dioic acid hydratase in catechol pathway